MPVEVVSLISSSDASSPPRPTARCSDLPHVSTAASRVSLFDSDDLFSSTTECRSRPNGGQPVPTAVNPVCLVSDDERQPSSPSQQVGCAPVDGPAPKRRRVDMPAFVSSPSPHRSFSSGRLEPTAGQFVDRLYDDPFASSSPLTAEKSMPRACSQVCGPLAVSSTRPREALPGRSKAMPALVDGIDPFASSSPAQAPDTSRPTQSAAAWDPISSSAPFPADHEATSPPRALRRTQSEIIDLAESDDDGRASSESDDEFPDITGLPAVKRAFVFLPSSAAMPAAADRPAKAKATTTTASSVKTKKIAPEKKGKEGEEKTVSREVEKERRRLEKERAKEQKAQEKVRAAALAEVNKIRTDKKVSTPEMIVDLPATLDETVKLQAETLLRDLDVQSTSWQSPVENVVKWRRKVRSRYNEELGHWEPIPERIERETFAMVVAPAGQFIDLVLGEDGASLGSHVLRMKRSFCNDTIIYLIEGLAGWMRKNRNVRNRQFVSAVRSGLDPADEAPSSSQANPASDRRRKNAPATPAPTYVDEETVEDALLELQVRHSVLIHHTAAAVETARWIAVFTQHISTVPYRRQRDRANDAGFCMETGQVRTGDGPRDTYVRMLQEIARLTAPIAYGIAAEFPSVGQLVRGLAVGGPLRLEKVRRSVNKEGDAGDRMVGQAVSRRVYKIFTGRDEHSTDI